MNIESIINTNQEIEDVDNDNIIDDALSDNKLSYATYSATEDDGALAMAAREVALKTRRALDIHTTTPPNHQDKSNHELLIMLEELRNRIEKLEKDKVAISSQPILIDKRSSQIDQNKSTASSLPIDMRTSRSPSLSTSTAVPVIDKRSGVVPSSSTPKSCTPPKEIEPVSVRTTALEALGQLSKIKTTNHDGFRNTSRNSPARSPTRSPTRNSQLPKVGSIDNQKTDFGFGNISKPPAIVSGGVSPALSDSKFTTPQFLTPNGSPIRKSSVGDILLAGQLKIPKDFPLSLPPQAHAYSNR